MENVFDAKDAQNYIDRINKLVEDTHGLWGKMTVDQMLAHCCVTYEMIYEPEKHKKPGAIAKFILKTFVKPKVVGEKSYPRDSPTAPQFLITGRKNFEEEKQKANRNYEEARPRKISRAASSFAANSASTVLKRSQLVKIVTYISSDMLS